MESEQGETTLSPVEVIRDLIRECYRLEHAGKMNLALQRGEKAERLARSSGQNDLVASALAAQAIVHAHLGHYATARRLSEDALSIVSARATGRAEAEIVLGICASETDDLDAADLHYHRAIDLCREIGDYQNLARALHDLASGVYYPRGQFDLAVVTDQEVLLIASRYGISTYQEYSWTTQALVYLAAGDWFRAEEALDNLEKLLNPDSRLLGYLHCLRAHLFQERGELETASQRYIQALALSEPAGDPGLSVETRWGLSRLHRLREDYPTAYTWADAAVSIASRSGYHHVEGRALTERARVSWAMNNHTSALKDLLRAIQCLETLKANFDLCVARLVFAALLNQIASKNIPIEIEAQTATDVVQSWKSAAQGIIDNGYATLFEREWRLVYPLVTKYLNEPDPLASELAARTLGVLQRSPPPLRISTLGRFEVYKGNHLIPAEDWRNRQSGELFRLLLISHGRTLTRDQIIEQLWPGKNIESVKASYHQTTSAVRKALDPDLPEKFPSRYLFLEEGTVTLRLPPGSQVDFETFEEYLRQEKLDEAISLFQGEPFPLDLYHDWAALKREQLNQQFLDALLKVAQHKLQVADPQGALTTCRRLLAVDPWQEQAVLTAMQACLRLNDRPEAIRLYLELERCLQQELSISPLPELRQLYQSLL
jgi:DNA-binding SARP family transcriptional activator